MSDREALTLAIDRVGNEVQIDPSDDPFHNDLLALLVAARERLAQLPENCECQSQHPDAEVSHRFSKVACNGSGKVYPVELVERIAKVLFDCKPGETFRDQAVAVLDALNEGPA